jgi:phosphatidylinositol-bisphosphatase
MRVDEVDSDDPDLFVFGFQELDLSTEALLYSSSTTREDAWCYAIFAALGEKGVKYEKVSVQPYRHCITSLEMVSS